MIDTTNLVISVKGVEELLIQLSDVLGVTIEALKYNGTQYILEYGKYAAFSKAMITVPVVGAILGIIGLLLGIVINAPGEYDSGPRKGWTWEFGIVGLISGMILGALSIIIPYTTSPLMWSINVIANKFLK